MNPSGANGDNRSDEAARNSARVKRYEGALKEGEDHLRSCLPNDSDIITILNADGTIRYASPIVERVLGSCSEELAGRLAFDYVHPEDIERISSAFAELLDNPGINPPIEFRVRQADGSWRYIELIPNNLLNDPTIRGILTTARDITERKRLEHALQENEKQMQLFSLATNDMLWNWHCETNTSTRSIGFERAFGYSSEDIISGIEWWKDRLHPEDRERVWSLFHEALTNGYTTYSCEYRFRRRDGSYATIEEHTYIIWDEKGNPVRALGAMTDVTKRRWAEEELRKSEEQFRLLAENAQDVVYRYRFMPTPGFEYVSPSVTEIVGYTPEEHYAEPELSSKIVHPDDRNLINEAIQSPEAHDGTPLTLRWQRKDGTVVWMEQSNKLVYDPEGNLVAIEGIARDITERKLAEEQLRHQAFHDSLTGLPNRHLFLDRLEHALAWADRRRSRVAVLLMDLDNFKVINDSLGHEVGDQLILAAAERLKTCLRPEDTLARFSGDEFTIVLEDIMEPSDAARVAARCSEKLQEPFVLGGRKVFTSASIGISLSSSACDLPEEIIRNADIAMYKAKEQGGTTYQVFDPSMYTQTLRRLELENDLRRAIGQEEFKIHYQPQVDLRTTRLVGMEALVRCEDPERSLVNPSEFIPVAEETGLIVPLGQWVMEEACRYASKWSTEYPSTSPWTMSVNLSLRQFQQRDLVEKIAGVLRETGLEPRCLSLEITESIAMKDVEYTVALFRELKGLGIRLAIDDFGTGHSSLNYLIKRFRIDILKIDRSFVGELTEDPDNRVLVSAIVKLAQALGLQVVAEGIETADQLLYLQEIGCDIGQGYYFARPLSREATSKFLTKATFKDHPEVG